MAEEKAAADADAPTAREFDFLEQADSGRDLTVRDDHYDFSWLLDGIKRCRSRGSRFRLIDSGRLDSEKMEWLGEAGADVYTSDSVGRALNGMTAIGDACRSGRAILAVLLRNPIFEDSIKGPWDLTAVRRMAGEGMDLHVTNREAAYPPSLLVDLALDCTGAGARLVYYHHGVPGEDLIRAAESGAWIHVSGEALSSEEEAFLLLDMVKAARMRKSGVVLHLDSPVTIRWLWDIIQEGGYLQFGRRQFDFRSPFRAVEDRARRRKPDFRAVYLDPIVFP